MSEVISRLGPFTLKTVAGEGATSQVWKGVHHVEGIPVAVKILAPVKRDVEFNRSRFLAEAHAVASLRHPGIVRILDYGHLPSGFVFPKNESGTYRDASRAPYLAMEWIEGGTLKGQAPLPEWDRFKSLALQLLEALSVSHARGIIHRDLKPSNVLLSGRGPVLADFGIAYSRRARRKTEPKPVMVGTPYYMSPEQIRGENNTLGPWTDLYSLGCLLFHVVTNRPPFPGKTLTDVIGQHLRNPPPTLPNSAYFPAGLEDWLHRLMSKAPSARFRLAADAARALMRLDLGGDSTLKPRSSQETIEKASIKLESTPLEESPLERTLVSPPVFVPISDELWSPRQDGDTLAPLADTWRPRHLSSESSRIPSGVGRSLFSISQARFLGREQERDFLWQRLKETVSTSRPRFVCVDGLAGIGKTALVRWIVERAHALGSAIPLWMRHQNPNGPTCGLEGFVEEFLAIGELDLDEREGALQAAATLHDVPKLHEILEPFIQDEGSHFGRSDTGPVFSTIERHRALYSLLEALCRTRPHILVIDDLQWGEDAQQFIHYLLKRRGDFPLLVLGTVRGETAHRQTALRDTAYMNLICHAESARLSLGPMTPKDQAALVSDRLRLSPELMRKLLTKSQGNPLFAEELVRHWIDTDSLISRDDGFRLDQKNGLGLPASIGAIWEARLKRVVAPDSDDWLALELASTLGRDISDSEWRAANEQAGLSVDYWLMSDLLQEGLLRFTTDEQWSFSHGLLRDFMQASAAKNGRLRRWHSLCADVLAAPQFFVSNERIGLHLLFAQRFEEAAIPLHAAMNHSAKRSAYSDAKRLCIALAQALRGRGVTRVSPEWLHLRLRWTILARSVGHREKAARHARQQVMLARLSGDKPTLCHALKERCLHRHGDVGADVLSWINEALEVAREIDDFGLIAVTASRSAELHTDLGKLDQAELLVEDALRHSVGRTDVVRASCLRVGANIALLRGQIDRAADYVERAIEMCSHVSSKWFYADCLNTRGDVRRASGDLRTAECDYIRAATVLRQIGNVDLWISQCNLGLIRGDLCHWAGAIAAFAKARETAESNDYTWAGAVLDALAIRPLAALGRFEEVKLHLARLAPPTKDTSNRDVASSLETAAQLTGSVNSVLASQIWTRAAEQYEFLGFDDAAMRCALRADGRVSAGER